MVRYAIWLLFATIVAWLVKKVLANATRRTRDGIGGRAGVSPQAGPKLLYRDPVCGAYIAEEISYPWEQGKETLHFCSRECLEHYRAGDRIAAGT
jgi:YHS domain-containing protein